MKSTIELRKQIYDIENKLESIITESNVLMSFQLNIGFIKMRKLVKNCRKQVLLSTEYVMLNQHLMIDTDRDYWTVLNWKSSKRLQKQLTLGEREILDAQSFQRQTLRKKILICVIRCCFLYRI